MSFFQKWQKSYQSLDPRLNLPTKLTILRIGLCPIFFIVIMFDNLISGYLALIFFVIAAISDAYDGYIARKDGLVTKFGKIIDPIADKLLISFAFIAFYLLGYIDFLWIIILILIREYAITLLRIIGVVKGVVIAADRWGKLKTIFQMTYIITLMVFINFIDTLDHYEKSLPGVWQNFLLAITDILLYLAFILTVGSGLNYVIKNRKFLWTLLI